MIKYTATALIYLASSTNILLANIDNYARSSEERGSSLNLIEVLGGVIILLILYFTFSYVKFLISEYEERRKKEKCNKIVKSMTNENGWIANKSNIIDVTKDAAISGDPIGILEIARFHASTYKNWYYLFYKKYPGGYKDENIKRMKPIEAEIVLNDQESKDLANHWWLSADINMWDNKVSTRDKMHWYLRRISLMAPLELYRYPESVHLFTTTQYLIRKNTLSHKYLKFSKYGIPEIEEDEYKKNLSKLRSNISEGMNGYYAAAIDWVALKNIDQRTISDLYTAYKNERATSEILNPYRRAIVPHPSFDLTVNRMQNNRCSDRAHAKAM